LITLVSTSLLGAGCNSSQNANVEPKIVSEEKSTDNHEDSEATIDTHVEIDTQKPTPTNTPSTATVTTKTPTMSTKPVSSSMYKDGTYSADGVYTSPAGAEHLPVTLTLKADVVTDAKVTVVATNQKSKYMQQQFADGFKQYVVGKKLNDVNVGKVSGSSLTGIGFNDAVAKIKAQAAVK
jgi:uncharacterized protein with FMN-binding domain